MAAIHGVFYLTAGLWVLVDIDSFQSVTGRKTDLWLVKTVACFITLTGLLLCVTAGRRRVPVELAAVALGQNLILSSVAFVYVLKGTISTIYLFDAFIQAAMALAWLVVLWNVKKSTVSAHGESSGHGERERDDHD